MPIRSFLCTALLLAVSTLATPAIAAEIPPDACPKQPTRIVVLGDSLADGLWGSLFRSYARCDAVETLRLTVVSDGLAKTSNADWLAKYNRAATKLKTRESDIVIVQIGANDITTIRDGRSRESYGTEAWQKQYSDRVSKLTNGLRSNAAKVYWFGLPIVGKSNLEGPYQNISALQKAAVGRAGGVFIDIHKLTQFGTGGFSQNGTYRGKRQALRAGDKVHFTKSGYDFVAQAVMDRLAKFTLERDRRAALQDVQLQ